MGKIHWGWATLLMFVAVFLAIVAADGYLERKQQYRQLNPAA